MTEVAKEGQRHYGVNESFEANDAVESSEDEFDFDDLIVGSERDVEETDEASNDDDGGLEYI